jgi:hypothetical protein
MTDESAAPLSTSEQEVAWCRATLQKLDKQLGQSIPLSNDDVFDVKRILNFLSRCHQRAETLLKKWKIPKVLKHLLRHSQILPDAIPPLIEMQLSAWDRGEYNLGPSGHETDGATGTDDTSEDSISEGEDDSPSLRGYAMRGIRKERSKKGKRWVYRVDKSYQRPASRFGPNGLEVGAWWPLQVCALRDGAHGSRMGGIYGKKEKGAYSIILSGGGGYDDRDEGDVVWYTGSGGKGEDQVLGIGNQALITSFNTKCPVRVLRGTRSDSRFAPSLGLRYDGLYIVTDHKMVIGRDGFKVFRYRLERDPDQKEIQLNIPGQAELNTLHQ